MPLTHVSGGVSNLSFSFRGNEPVREAMHSVFLYQRSAPGWTWTSSTPASSRVYEEIDPELREACEDVVLNRRKDSTERLLTLAEKFKVAGAMAQEKDAAWREASGRASVSNTRWSTASPNTSTSMSRRRAAAPPARSTSSRGR